MNSKGFAAQYNSSVTFRSEPPLRFDFTAIFSNIHFPIYNGSENRSNIFF